MAEQAIINTSTLTSIGDAIREKTGKSDTFLPSDMPAEILAIETGSDVSGVTATASDVRSGKKFVNSSGAVVTGTVTARTASNVTSSNNVVVIPAGIYDSKVSKTVGTAKRAATYTPGTSDQTIPAGRYLTGAQTIKGDANLEADNIISGKSIFGVTGWAPKAIELTTGNTTYKGGSLRITLSSSDISSDIQTVDALCVWATTSNSDVIAFLRPGYTNQLLVYNITDSQTTYSNFSISGREIDTGIDESIFPTTSVYGFVAVGFW